MRPIPGEAADSVLHLGIAQQRRLPDRQGQHILLGQRLQLHPPATSPCLRTGLRRSFRDWPAGRHAAPPAPATPNPPAPPCRTWHRARTAPNCRQTPRSCNGSPESPAAGSPAPCNTAHGYAPPPRHPAAPRRISRWNRHSVDGFNGPSHAPSPSSAMAAISPGAIASYGVADGVISIRPPKRAEILPDVPWLIPSVFIDRACSIIARRRLLSSMVARPLPGHVVPQSPHPVQASPILTMGYAPDYTAPPPNDAGLP